MQGTTLFLFTNDLRLSDNQALLEASSGCQRLLCLYCVDPAWFRPGRYQSKVMGNHRWQFLRESIDCLASQLEQRRQTLLIRLQSPLQAIEQLLKAHKINTVYRSHNVGYQEVAYWQSLQQRFPAVTFKEVTTFTLFDQEQPPFTLDDLPETYSQFRKKVERLAITEPATAPDIIPTPMAGLQDEPDRLPPITQSNSPFTGGETAGTGHLRHYFSTMRPSTYKETRNALQGPGKLNPVFSLAGSWLYFCPTDRPRPQALRSHEYRQ